jgi:hypothetical protein
MRRFRSPEEWQALIKAHANSNMTVVDFCNKQNVHHSQFYRMRKRLSREILEREFIELEVPSADDLDLSLSVGAIRIHPGPRTNKDYLKMVLSAAVEVHNASIQ